MKSDVVVIGSGFGGLSTAILLGRFGLKVTVVDGATKPGGCLRSYTREGVDCPVGVHYVGAVEPGEILGDFIDALGIRGALALRRIGQSGILDRYIFDDEIFDLPNCVPGFEATLRKRFADAPDAVSFVIEMCRSAIAGLRSDAPAALPPAPFTKNAAEFLASQKLPGRLVDILAVQGFLLGANLRDCPASFLPVLTASLLLSASELGTTGIVMADAMAERAREAGVTMILSDAVTAVNVDSGGACGVRLESGASLDASTVIAGIHPKTLLHMLPNGAYPDAYALGLDRLQETGGILCVVALVDSARHPPNDHNVFRLRGLPREELQGIYAQLRPSGVPGRTRLILLKASSYDAWAPWHATRTGRRGAEYRSEKARQAQELLKEAEAVIGPIRDAQIIDVWTPLTLRDWIGAPQGGTYGVRHSIRDGMDFLVLSRPPLDRLFLVGQNAIAPGLLGTSMGVLRVVGCLVGRDAVRELLHKSRRATGEP